MDNNQQEIPNSTITITFAAPGAVLMDVQWDGVFPGQLIVAGDYLIQKGREFSARSEAQKQAQEKEQKIVVPKPTIVTTK